MTKLTGNEPAHWHRERDNGAVQHNMTDPRTLAAYPKAHWNADERAYVEHLEEHERTAHSAEPQDDDHPLVSSCLAYLANQERMLEKMRYLVLALRQELARGVPPKESEAAAAIKKLWPQFTGTATGSDDSDGATRGET